MGHPLKSGRQKATERLRRRRPSRQRPLVFVDTNVIIAYLHGEPTAQRLFSEEEHGRATFAINPIVLQELLLAANGADPNFKRIRPHLRVLPLDLPKAQALLGRLPALRNRRVHANDFLIMSSAEKCDFLVTSDKDLKNLVTTEKPQVVTPEQLVTRLRAA